MAKRGRPGWTDLGTKLVEWLDGSPPRLPQPAWDDERLFKLLGDIADIRRGNPRATNEMIAAALSPSLTVPTFRKRRLQAQQRARQVLKIIDRI